MIESIEQELSNFIYEAFPPEIKVLSAGGTSKKGKAKTVLCKTNGKFRKGTRLDVFTEETIDLGNGKTEVIQNKVGELKITAIKSSKVIEGKVIKGSSDIYKLKEEKITLKCKPSFRTGMFDSINSIRN